MSSPQPQKFNWLPLGMFALLVVVLGGLYALRGDQSERAKLDGKQTTEESEESRRNKMRGSSTEGMDSDKSSSAANRVPISSSTTDTLANAAETTSPPERTTEDPMGYVVHDFRNHQMSLAGFKVDNILETEEGLKLGPTAIDTETTDGSPAPRIGTIESPALTLVAASNLVAPNWKEILPETSNIKVELSCSADQNDWTEWFPIDRGDNEMSPTYPDGAPNPNYGNTPGTHVAFGLKLYPYVRYRLTLASTSQESPIFQQMRLYHVDGTGGNGVLADQAPPDPPQDQPAPSPDAAP
jgi:hypothetical protein